MTQAKQDNADERRRRLLKGALATSSVMTLGYGGPLAAASLSCIAKIDGGYPTGTNQFFIGAAPPATPGGGNWAWKMVEVNRYQSNGNGVIDGFEVDGNVYRADNPEVLISAAIPKPNGSGDYPKKAWLLVYFDPDGIEAGTYPTYTVQGEGFTPAVSSCLTSINPGIVANYGFGG
ncbi:hypothetical protein [Aromatoleum aromaticum]|uniref:Uncharacterized protein n=1 Tax=Aromatoleum aromaticum (strain DSM 19018 / LMG 30748 / EbN1) TaxID=76114 RepID=Q5P7H2_AROAE|nr:hypothetical protein [Aromatoleum aromaticum]NMG53053.1 hypothetical protein [Aromatoleum aromaticum]CAI06739.1 hypothetical protein ebA1171 [Aromatoleum aromaticum EbN1]